MATPVFQRQNTKLNGVFTSDKATLKFAEGIAGTLVQGFNFTYSQNVTRLYEVGSEGETTNIYYVGGRTQGMCQLNRVIGPNAAIKELYAEYGNVCKENTLRLTLTQADCRTSGGSKAEQITYDLKFCVLTQVGVSVQAQDMIINEQSQIMFSGCDYT